MTIAVGAVCRIIAQQQDVNGSIIQNVFHYQHNGTNPLIESTFLGYFENALSGAYAQIEDYIPNTCDPVSLVCDVVAFSGGKIVTTAPIGEIAWTTWAGGTGSGEGLPQGCAALANLTTFKPGVQGRKYVGPLTEGCQNGGVLIAAAQTALAAFAADIIGTMVPGGENFDPVVMSTKLSLPVFLQGVIAKAVVAYQRRRKAGSGS